MSSESHPIDPWSNVVADAVSWRRHLHQHPELAFNELNTAQFIADRLEQVGLVVHRGLAGTGVIGTLSRGTSKRVIGIRADMDALPIQEQSATTYTSGVPGLMHACGHDGHVAMALAAARVCARLPSLDGTVHFIFQPAEEAEGGARRMVEEGLFRKFPCDSVYALHNWPPLPVGTCVVRDDVVAAAMGVFEIELTGRGCHGATPHLGTDSLLAACHLVMSLQSVVSRSIDALKAAVVSVTQIHAGDTWNTVPDSTIIRGTTRWFDESVGETIEQRMRSLAIASAAAYGCEARIHYERRFPATINHAAQAAFVRSVITKSVAKLAIVEARPAMGSEDFAYMLQAVPGCYVLLGAGKSGDNPGLHSSRYDFNDDVISVGTELWVSLVRTSLSPT